MHGRPSAYLVAMILLCVSSGASGQVNYRGNLAATGTFMATQQLADGAILTDSTDIVPYFANYAAIGWLKGNKANSIEGVEAWITWYLGHLNRPDSQGIYGTVYDYTYDPSTGRETSTGTYDSADAYAATFLQLLAALWNTGNAGAQEFIRNTVGERDPDTLGTIITDLQQPDGLVIVEPDYPVAYLIDNTEDWAALTAYARLAGQAWGDNNTQGWYEAHAASIRNGILALLYMPSTHLYYPYLGSSPPVLSNFYPDAVAQLWPSLMGVVTGSQANTSYAKFNAAWPGWTKLSFATPADPFPWCAISYAAFLAGDRTSASQYVQTIQSKYVDVRAPFSWPFTTDEAGWFMRTNSALAGLD